MKTLIRVSLILGVVALAVGATVQAANSLTPMERLGKFLLFDKNLSSPAGQDCAFCHGPAVGFTGPISVVNDETGIYPGAIPTRFGNRKPPAAAYGGDSPILYWNSTDEVWVGGMFWDGRATGWTLGDPLAEQAQGPFLNPLEQNMPSREAVCQMVEKSTYARLFRTVWGRAFLDCGAGIEATYEKIARSIAAYERSKEVNRFNSKFDVWLRDGTPLSPMEEAGRLLFEGKAMCAACHPAPLFTDFTYDNLGVPRNPANPFYESDFNPLGYDWVDEGLGAFLRSVGYDETVWMSEIGKMKVPTLRNIDRRPYDGFVKAYGHNGYFRSLESIVHFYNTRDVLPTCMAGMVEGVDCWPAAEATLNVNTEELGNLGLTLEEEAQLVAFLKTLSDRGEPFKHGPGVRRPMLEPTN